MESSLNEQTLERVTEIFKALSDGNRLRVMHLLIQNECSVGHIAHTLNLSQSNVSHQLRILKQAHLVKSNRNGQSMIYRIDDSHVTTLIKQAIHHATH
ncbi:ArsR/SmtB family transcription factor [Staphylococcus edaphicus]|uniref:Metalloregulator ArsR/SmtB family transcription factor n=1 Tax=Staphylococcus edaphicus TaxID=1955013 RepID=A0A2C6VFI3_9STAP|nr:metalloregulator ArsR/SmtB family transcription factor [Staphylococcus edaphicus]PHK49071.1 transcriptional regulator [Staphylococcus edaphicus]UQW82261.1 metalloregulator ArsR/SmtB family transcription factor [Staphylococcus edaphicus]